MVKREYSKISKGPMVRFSLGGKKGKKLPYTKVTQQRFKGGGNSILQELKFFDNANSFSFDATNEIPATGQLCTIAQGDGQSNRDGRKVIVKSIYCNGAAVYQPGASATSADIAYLWLVQDTQCNGAAATVADDNVGIFTTAGANASLAVRCLANGDRFKILKKWSLPLGAQAGVTAAYNNSIKPVTCYLKCHIPIEYDASAATGAIATIRSNNIFLVAGTAGLSDDLISVNMTTRLRFIG